MNQTLRVGLVGCGNIAGPYARDLVTHPEIELAGVADLLPERAGALAAQVGCRAYPTVEALLADERIDLAVNLTVHHAHAAVSRQCLEAGKHVFSEKPLALTGADAWQLVALAREKGLRLGGSPFTVMGEAQQTAWKAVREGCLGPVRTVYAEVNWGRLETWHPAPAAFYEVGPLFDVGVYPLAILTTMFGPARRVAAHGHTLWPERTTQGGETFRVTAPDFVVALIELEGGPLVRLTANFYVTQKGRQAGIEFHGDVASLYLPSWHMFNAEVEMGEFNQPYRPVPLVREPYPGCQWGRAVVDMAHAIRDGRPHRASGEQAAHVVDILCATAESMQSGGAVAISSTFPRQAPMEWAQ
jgi:predicted dehydrogenase